MDKKKRIKRIGGLNAREKNIKGRLLATMARKSILFLTGKVRLNDLIIKLRKKKESSNNVPDLEKQEIYKPTAL